MCISSGNGLWCKAVLLVAVGLVLFCDVRTTDVQQQNAKQTIVDSTKTPSTLANMFRLLKNLDKRCVNYKGRLEVQQILYIPVIKYGRLCEANSFAIDCTETYLF